MADNLGGQQNSSYRLSGQDASFIYGETSTGPLHIGSIGIFEGRIDFEAMVGHLDERLQFIPRYRQRLARAPFNIAHPQMEDDPQFSLDHHAFRHELPSDTDEADAFEEMLRTFEKPLNRTHPLWEVHSYENLPGDRTALLWKVHHCLIDGVSGVELLKVMYDLRAEPTDIPPPPEPWKPAPSAGLLERLTSAVRDRVATVVDNAITAADEIRNQPAVTIDRVRMASEAVQMVRELTNRKLVTTPWNAAPITQDRALAWTKLPFSDFRAIRSAFGGSINDVVLTILTEGAARYLDHHGYEVEGEQMCIGCPVNIRHKAEQKSLGNRVSMMFPIAPAQPMDVVERLKLLSAETERIKAHGGAQALETLMSITGEIPPAVVAAGTTLTRVAFETGGAIMKLTGWKPQPGGFALSPMGINFVATNVPGVQIPLYMNGHTCLDMVPLVPLGATLGYAVAILSYYGSLYFGMMASPAVMPDVPLMKRFVEDAFADLKRRSADRMAEVEPAEPKRRPVKALRVAAGR